MAEALNTALVDVSGELLRQALGLPPGTLIVACREGRLLGDVQLRVEHQDLRPVSEGEAIPTARPSFSRDDKTGRPVFEGWGQ